MLFNVRCCCQPTKVIGTLELGSDRALHRVSDGSAVELRVICDPYAKWEELAVYSDDRPVEFWRGIRGFTEGAMTTERRQYLCQATGLSSQQLADGLCSDPATAAASQATAKPPSTDALPAASEGSHATTMPMDCSKLLTNQG